MVAIVTDVRYRMSLALIRDLGQAGVEVITCERERCRQNAASPALGALSRWTSRHVWLPEEGYKEALLDLCGEIGEKPALLPVGAATLETVARDRSRFDAVCGLCAPTLAQLDRMNSKERAAALAESLGVPVPESFVRREGEDLTDFARRLPLPCVIKPVCGEKLGLHAAERYAAVSTPEEAERAYARFLALAGSPPVVQRQLTGGALGCSVLALEGRVLASICHRRLREYPVSGGPASCCLRVERPDLPAYAERMAAETGYTGLAMFEFKEDGQGRPHLLEVNPRIWGTFPLTRASRSGIPLLWFLLAWNAGHPEDPVPLPRPDPPRSKKMIFAASDLSAAAGYLKRGQPRQALGALADLVNPTVRDGVFEWGDPLPGLAYVRSLLAKERRP